MAKSCRRTLSFGWRRLIMFAHVTTPCPACAGTGQILDRAAFGAQMQAKREAAGLTLRELAERMEMSIGYVSDLEHGRKAWGDGITWKYG